MPCCSCQAQIEKCKRGSRIVNLESRIHLRRYRWKELARSGGTKGPPFCIQGAPHLVTACFTPAVGPPLPSGRAWPRAVRSVMGGRHLSPPRITLLILVAPMAPARQPERHVLALGVGGAGQGLLALPSYEVGRGGRWSTMNHPWSITVDPWSTHGRPWSTQGRSPVIDHCRPIVDHHAAGHWPRDHPIIITVL